MSFTTFTLFQEGSLRNSVCMVNDPLFRRMLGFNLGRRNTGIPIQPESGLLARRGRAPGLAKGLVARSRKASSYNHLDRVIEHK